MKQGGIRYPSAWLHPCRARFCFAWHRYFSSIAAILGHSAVYRYSGSLQFWPS